MSPVRMQLPVTAAVHMTKKQAHLGLLPASELRKGRTMAQTQKLQNSGMQIPDDAILRIAQAMLPLMQQYFESEEGRLQLSRQTEALAQKEAAPASQPKFRKNYHIHSLQEWAGQALQKWNAGVS